MAFTYDPALSTDRDRLRFHLADTRDASHDFEDAELDALLTLEGSIYAAAAAALDNMATQIAQSAQSYSNATPDGISRTQDNTARIEALRARADHFRKLAGGGSLPSINIRTLREPPGSSRREA